MHVILLGYLKIFGAPKYLASSFQAPVADKNSVPWQFYPFELAVILQGKNFPDGSKLIPVREGDLSVSLILNPFYIMAFYIRTCLIGAALLQVNILKCCEKSHQSLIIPLQYLKCYLPIIATF